MSEMKNVPGVLDLIRNITANRESGRLEINASGTYGTLLFNEGQLIDARLGSLSGFPAVNATLSLPDAQFSFDHVAPATHASTISQSERVVLQRFFGIEAAEIEQPGESTDVDPEWNAAPEQVVPLDEVAEVPQTRLDDTPTIEVEPPVRSRSTVPATVFAFVSRTRVAVALVLLLCLAAVAAIALRSRIKARQLTASVAEVDSRPAQQQVPSESPSVPVEDLTGEWRVVNTVEKTNYKSFDNMEVGFHLVISQTGKDFTAKGEKFSENGQTLSAANRTPIQLTGTISGDKVVATFVEDGRTRRTNGRFVWRVQSDGDRLAGTFVSSAANSSGRSAVTKQ